ncbi:MAG: hypothetical protein ACI4I8_03365, partial [Oscillospiraceae bacterium]
KEEKTYQLKQRLRILLELPVTAPQQNEILKKEGLPVRYRDHLQLVAWNLYQKALGGDMAAILQYIPLEELRECLRHGIVEPWDLAEHFGVTEEFMRKSIGYYRDVMGIAL